MKKFLKKLWQFYLGETDREYWIYEVADILNDHPYWIEWPKARRKAELMAEEYYDDDPTWEPKEAVFDNQLFEDVERQWTNAIKEVK